MKRSFGTVLMLLVITAAALAYAGMFDDLLKGLDAPSQKGPDNSTVVSGLKEALSIGTENAVKNVSRPDGYFSNEMIRILMPEKIQKVADVLRKVGYQKEVDEFILSMNRAAEKAAPMATSYFVGAIKEMSIGDAQKILNGGDTAATDYFKRKTSDRLVEAFKPVVSSSMNEVGVTKKYKDMMGRYESLPFVDKESVDLDSYVTKKATDGLFFMVGEEEKKIRTDPAARVTDLLKTVFGK
jgi:hypothetical protein